MSACLDLGANRVAFQVLHRVRPGKQSSAAMQGPAAQIQAEPSELEQSDPEPVPVLVESRGHAA